MYMLLTPYDCFDRIDALSLWKLYIPLSNKNRRGWVIREIPNPETVAQHCMLSALMVTWRFRDQLLGLGINIGAVQDTLLIHDIAEPDPRVDDITPNDNISDEEKLRREYEVIVEMLWDNAYLFNLWLDYEFGRTPEWRMAMEIDKLQAIKKARYYEDKERKPGLVQEFYTHSVIKKNQITTDFLLQYAHYLRW